MLEIFPGDLAVAGCSARSAVMPEAQTHSLGLREQEEEYMLGGPPPPSTCDNKR